MIQRLIVNNFQSHRKTELELDPGVTAIVGSSDSGKSALMRALIWAVTNRPAGLAFASHWAVDAKGKLESPVSVQVLTDTGSVRRYRDAERNAYEVAVDGAVETLEAVRTDVPEQVRQFFNLTEVNIQEQFDSHFLLAETGGGVARFLNKIIRLDVIDRFLAGAEKKRRDAQRELTDVRERLIPLCKEEERQRGVLERADQLVYRAAKYNDRRVRKADQGFLIWEELEVVRKEQVRVERLGRWIREGGRYLLELETVRASRLVSAEQLKALCRDVEAHERAVDQRQVAERMLSKAPGLLKRLEAVEGERKAQAAQALKLGREVVEYRRMAEVSERASDEIHRLGPPLARAEEMAAALREMSPKLKRVQEQLQQHRMSLREWEMAGTRAEQAAVVLQKAERDFCRVLPDVCPLCGKSTEEAI